MPDHFYVYPQYLEKGLSRARGRRIPAGEGLVDPTAEEIAQAAKKLGTKAEVEEKKHYPRQFFQYSGRVKVSKRERMKKAQFLRALAAEVHRLRAQAGRK
ncbi:MAG: signal recognition particle subunit SRP19/SEC65 family protein [Thermoplasmata archaeon]|nr:signal recognition particle subunit SRP19/SEC65 family protein [Thermoplasmata archaeon]